MVDWSTRTREVAQEVGIDVDLFWRQIRQESGFDPEAYNASSDASGLGQIVPRFHPNVNVWNPEENLQYAARLMLSHYKKYGTYRQALIAYNWGPGNLSKWNGNPGSLPLETYRYLTAILGLNWPEPTKEPPVNDALKLSAVLDRGRSRIGDPYVWGGKTPPNTDCSGFVAWCYFGKVTSFTDAIYPETVRVEKPAPGDIVLYGYDDDGQPGVQFPHVGLYLSDALTLDNRFGLGVGEHNQLSRNIAVRFYRRLSGVIVDTDGSVPVPPPPVDSRDARIAQLEKELVEARNLVGNAYNYDGEVRKALLALNNQIDALDDWLGNQRG